MGHARRRDRAQIPKLRQGSYFPSFLQPRKRSEQALVSVVQQAYVCGVSTRRVDQLVESLGLRISRSEVSRIAALLDEQVQAFRERPLEGRYPYLFVDAKVEKVRDGGRVVRKALVVAHGVHETGRREIVSLDVGAAETEAFWREFLRSLVARGLVGVQLANAQLIADWQAKAPSRAREGVAAANGARLSRPSTGQAARQETAPDPALRSGVDQKARTLSSASWSRGGDLRQPALELRDRLGEPLARLLV